MLGNITELKKLGEQYGELEQALKKGRSVTAFGLSLSQKCVVASLLDKQVLFVLPDDMAARKAHEELAQLNGEGSVVLVIARDEVLLYKKALSPQNLYARLAAYARIARGGARIIVTSATALTQIVPRPQDVAEAAFTLSVGQRIPPEELASRLVRAGYRREDMVEGAGQFSLRGEILDVYPVGAQYPVRADFFDVEIESLRNFDMDTQVSGGAVQEAEILPATDVFLTEEEKRTVLSRMAKVPTARMEAEAASRFAEIRADVELSLAKPYTEPHLSYVLPFVDDRAGLEAYLDKDAYVLFDEPKQITDKLELVYREHFARFESLLASGEVTRDSLNQLFPHDRVLFGYTGHPSLAFQIITTANRLFPPQEVYSFKTGNIPRYNQNVKELQNDLGHWLKNRYSVVIAAGNPETAKNVADSLTESGLPAVVRERPESGGISVLAAELNTGYIFHGAKLVVVGTGDIIARRQKVLSRRNKKDVFVAPQVGDYVVHEQHGIGICRGIRQLDGQFGLKDFVVVEYREGDTLYVPIDQMDQLSKYSGEKTPHLNKIGGREFEKLKARVKSGIREMAIDLHKLYLERTQKKGFRFSPDTPFQREFEEKFPHTETPDQLRAIAEVKADMESDRIMDRLLCGDVGYGKTEVAFRAVFKAVMDGKQAAFLSPTTILSQQHYNTACARFSDFGLRVEVMNRFKSAGEQADIAKRVAAGKVDVLIGTHRILSADVRFADLGLLVVDEEQRFGVEHKEKIKTLKENVDVLTMSATPIPRTLHMSMVGIRDMSVIETPPQERLPVQSYVIEETDALLRDAIVRELQRDGQVFVLYNSVERIASFAASLKELVPEAEITVAHGQMDETKLENAVYRFYNNESNVLVCTTIIENGIDLPNANTLIVIDADRLGLSQLYQLRGRVGRSNRLAHAYFTYKKGKVFSEQAYKRLSAIMEFTEFGSGFKIAMRDLEIRGAGDVLGAKQHGHMDKVGYDMYVKLLKECVEELRGTRVEHVDTTIEAQVPAFIDEAYIKSEEGRMRAYRRIAEVAAEPQREELLAELNDIYGPVPEGVVNLIDIAYIKNLASRLGAASVTLKRSGAGIAFADNRILSDKRAITGIQANADLCILGFSTAPTLTIATQGCSGRDIVKNTLKILKSCVNAGETIANQ